MTDISPALTSSPNRAAKRAAPPLQRVAFKSSRLAEFCGEKELVAQTGQNKDVWPLVILKELADNAIDEAEEAGIAPEIRIEVSTEPCEITITDNGRGIPAETVETMLDYTVRVSSREAYVSPTRGAQGNALKCIVAMGFALDGVNGMTLVESLGCAHRIVFEIDPVRREPRITHGTASSLVKTGTRITVRWPDSACSILEDAKPRFLQIAADFTWLNPHLSLFASWNGEACIMSEASDPGWGEKKWRACDPTSAHWYDADRFTRYIAAHIARDQDHGQDHTVREFIAELRGLTGSVKQKAVLDEVGASRTSLSAFFAEGKNPDGIARLLAACQKHTRPVKPAELGYIGEAHLRQTLLTLGAQEGMIKYKKKALTHPDGMPCVIETAFGWRPNANDRRIVVGVNWSAAIGNPFPSLGSYGKSLSSILADQRAQHHEPIVFVLHYTCPRVQFVDRGKSAVRL